MQSIAPESKGPFRADWELVQAVQKGAPWARKELGHRMQCVARFLGQWNRRYAQVLSADSLEDAAQEACVQTLQRLGSYRGQSRLESWIWFHCRAAFHQAIRRRQPLPARLDDAVPEPSSKAENWLHEQNALAVHTALRSLETLDEELFRSHYFGNRSFAYLAKQHSLPLGTVKARYYRSVEKLRVALADWQD